MGFQDLRGQRDVTLENLIITNPDGRCLDLTGARNVTIRRVTFLSCGTDRALTDGYDTGLIQIVDAQGITIENSTIRNFSNEAFGGERNNAIQISGSSNIVIRSTWFKQINSDISDGQGDKGNRAIKVTGSMNGLTIDSNHFDDAGRNAVQISRLRGGERISITNNVIEGRGRWDSDYEDMINLFSSSGTASDPIHISGNTFRNGGPSRSGTGIILGDGNISSGPSQYILVENNRFIDPGHVGINLAGGNNITIRNNTIVGTGDVPHRTTTGFTINHFGYSTDCRDHVVTGNRVWMDNQHLSSGTNHAWVPQTCTSNVQLSGNIFGDETLR